MIALLYDERKSAVEECFFGRAASAFSGKKIRCRGLEPEDSELGYTSETVTDGWREIYIARCHDMMRDMDDDHAALFRCGICVHETLHQIYTDFVSFSARMEKYSRNRANLYSKVFNIVEDSRIEGFAYLSFGGEMLASLEYAVKTIWEKSEEISEESPDYIQVLSALIQMGDCGEYKGKLSAEAEKCLNRIRPLFARGICTPSGVECAEISGKITDILLKICPSGMKFESARTPGEGRGKQPPVACESEKKKVADYICGGCPEDGKAMDELSGKEKSDIEKACRKLREKLEEEKKKSAERKLPSEAERSSAANADLFSGYTGGRYCEAVNNTKPEFRESDADEYGKICCDFPSEIKQLARTMSRALATEPSRKIRSGKGKIDLNRYNRYLEKSYTGAKLFSSMKDEQRHDVCIMLVVDCSGSMASYERYRHARNAAVLISEACRLNGIPLYVMGYTADKKKIGTADHIHYLTWNGSVCDRYSIAGISPQRENRDGPTIRYASRLIKSRSEKNKLMIVISDGSPQAYNYTREEAAEDTRRAVREARKNCSVLGICINSDEEEKLKEIYDGNYLSVGNLRELPQKLCRRFQTISSQW